MKRRNPTINSVALSCEPRFIDDLLIFIDDYQDIYLLLPRFILIECSDQCVV